MLIDETRVLSRWKEYFHELMNVEKMREEREEVAVRLYGEVHRITEDEVRRALKRMKNGKAVGPDDIPVEAWICLGDMAVRFLTRLFNRILEGERMPEEWRKSILVPIFKNKGDAQSCTNYRGIKLINHSLKIWERVIEARLRRMVTISEQQYGFMPSKLTTDAMFALKNANRKVQRETERVTLRVCRFGEGL